MTLQSAQPPADLVPGATSSHDGTVTFVLYAPGKERVSLIGEFNGWDAEATPLRATDSGLWWGQQSFAPGRHTYQFVVDGTTITDPYARALAEGAEAHPPRGIVEVGGSAYEWQHDGWQRPLFHELAIYEMHLGDFTPEGTIAAAMARLDYLRDLGINCIELMPVFEFAGEKEWGYNPSFYFTVEKSYGSPTELRQLIDECHARGIAVVLDMVLTHTGHPHPFNQIYPYDQSPWYGTPIGEENQFGFPSFDYMKGPAMAFARDVMHFWLQEMHIDGFRFDYLLGLGMHGDKGVPFLVAAAREMRADAFLIGEYSPENPHDVNASGLDGAWRVSTSYAIVDLLAEDRRNPERWQNLSQTAEFLDPAKSGYNSAAKMVNYSESHDEERLVRVLREAGFDEGTARFKSALGATILFTMPGEPMIYQGQEWGEETARTQERNVLHWELLDSDGGRGLHSHYQKVAWLRRHHPALQGESFKLDAVYADQQALVYHRWNAEGDEVVVAVNFSPVEQTFDVPFPNGGRWRDEISGGEIEVADAQPAPITLPGSSAAVLIKH